jgi:hypothetical protein
MRNEKEALTYHCIDCVLIMSISSRVTPQRLSFVDISLEKNTPMLRQWVKVKWVREDNAKRHGALRLVALCFATGTQLPLHSCYITLITITATCLRLVFKAPTVLCILGPVRGTLPHVGNNRRGSSLHVTSFVIVCRVFLVFPHSCRLNCMHS